MFGIGPKDMKTFTEHDKRRNPNMKRFLMVTQSVLRSTCSRFTPGLYIAMINLCLGTE